MEYIDRKSYRLSSYTIPVKLDATPEQTMLVHGYTGAIDIAHNDIVSFLQTRGPLVPGDAPFTERTWDALVARGYITTRSADEEQAFVARMADAYHRRSKLFNGFTFIPSYDCNFRCPYCVEAQVSCNGEQWSKQTLTREMVDRAYAAMDEIGPHREFHVKQILLYGGEPLLRENKQIVQYIVEKGCALGYRFKAITNGYDLEEFEDLLNPEMINTLQITVDGSREWHDRRRTHYRDGGSFDKIVGNIGLALKAGVGVAVRVNTDRNNFASLAELKTLFTELGYYRYEKLFSLHVGWLFDTPQAQQNGNAGDIDYFNLKDLNQKLKNSDIVVNCPSDSMCQNLYAAISQKKRVNLTPVGCTSQTGAYVFDPKGDLYSCLEVVGLPDHSLGNYAGPGKISWRPEQVERWHSTNIVCAEQCSKCKYALFCRGGCAFKRMQNKTGSYCDSFVDSFRTAANKAYTAYASQNTMP